MRKVFFAMPVERNVAYEASNAFAEICFYLGNQPTEGVEYRLLTVGYQPIDSSRNYLAFKFMEQAVSEDDTLVMLDNDHLHPIDIVERLVKRNKPVVGALAFKRKAPFFPVAYVRDPKDNRIKIPIEYPSKLCKVQRIGGAAIAIQKQVFDRLSKKGYQWPWFRWTYQDWSLYRGGEDIYFMEACEKSGVPVYCDFSLVTPHLDTVGRAAQDWSTWTAVNEPEYIWNGQSIKDELIETVPVKYEQE